MSDQPSPATPTSEARVLSWPVVLALAVIPLYAFGELARGVRSGEVLLFDRVVMESMDSLASPLMTTSLRLITASASTLVVTCLTLAMSIWWWRQTRRRSEVIILLVTVASSAALGQVLKALFTRPRPQVFPWLTTEGGWSFPSGHTLAATVLGGLVSWFIGGRQNSRRRRRVWGAAALWVILVGASRVYLGVHYPSDVLASVAVGVFCLLLALGTVQGASPGGAGEAVELPASD